MIGPEQFKSIGRHMGRERYSEGSLTKVGKRRKKWLGYWYVYVMVDGHEARRKRKKILGPAATMSRQQAKELLRSKIAESRGESPKVSALATFRETWERFCALKEAAWSKHTAETIRGIFKTSVLPTLGSLPIRDVTIDPVQAVIVKMARAGRSKSSLSTVRTYCKALFEYALDGDLITKNPVRGKKLVIPSKGPSEPCERFLELDEIHALFAAAPPREHLILRLFVVGGFRPAELFVLRVNDVEPGQIRVDEAMKQAEVGDDRLGETKTRQSKAYVGVSAGLQEELDRWIEGLEDATPGAWLFPSATGTPIRPGNYLKRDLKPLAVRAGVGVVDIGKREEDGTPILTSDVTYQALRRTCATYFRRDLKSAQRQLRHSTPLTTSRHYLKSISTDHRAAVEALDAELCPAKPEDQPETDAKPAPKKM